MPKAAIQQVAYGVLAAAKVHIYILPVIYIGFIGKGIRVFRVHVAQVVPTAAGITGHGVGLQVSGHPFGIVGQRAAAIATRFVAFYRR